MRRLYLIFISILLLTSCKSDISKEDLSKINGYWEIEKVHFPNGEDKEYTINETNDYFEIKNDQGFRKKVIAQLNGKYLENGLAEKIKVEFKEDKVLLHYVTPYAKWTEEVIEISDEKLVLKNNDNLEYHYKKPIPFSLK